jgi:P-type Cu+ transporter
MKSETEDRSVELDLEGMTCASCAARIEKVLKRQPGVTDASVNFASERARVAGSSPVDTARSLAPPRRRRPSRVLRRPD